MHQINVIFALFRARTTFGSEGRAGMRFDIPIAAARAKRRRLIQAGNEWKKFPRPNLAAQRRPATQCHDGKFELSSAHSEGEAMGILYVGIDLAKNVFAVHGVNEAGAAELRQPRVTRAKLHALIASLPACVIGMEACSGAHHWARLFQAHGHTVRLMAPKFVAALPHERQARQERRSRCDGGAAKRCSARTCASCRSRAWISNPASLFIALARGS
jgi:hypothetical protein